ncbi:two pore domain potassium channel family protein [Phototrophicus methaneseepsis]|uniref:Two pore domain potassium channel family protein n=1 Tax=Phototrophicus methaneseepsis TaxID=2710758 RepID=A0A7S8E879_9CHLR|nr:potassium channel family protein [Phototrophicus methaneseepsis]QPC82145.1 two pore domain potassium channel family protein [Phototrophicus methaneseepsis]
MPLPILFAIGNLVGQFLGALRRAWGDPASRGLIYSVGLLIALGTFIFHTLEGWDWVDSLYFTVITLTTVGYGDFAPQTQLGKLFTVLYIILGLGLLGSFITLIGTHSRANLEERRNHPRGRRQRRKRRSRHNALSEESTEASEEAIEKATSEEETEETE